jgi:hypothetical protein
MDTPIIRHNKYCTYAKNPQDIIACPFSDLCQWYPVPAILWPVPQYPILSLSLGWLPVGQCFPNGGPAVLLDAGV